MGRQRAPGHRVQARLHVVVDPGQQRIGIGAGQFGHRLEHLGLAAQPVRDDGFERLVRLGHQEPMPGSEPAQLDLEQSAQ